MKGENLRRQMRTCHPYMSMVHLLLPILISLTNTRHNGKQNLDHDLQQIQIIKNWDQCFSCLYCISRYYKCNFDNVKSLRIAFGLDFSKFYGRSKLKALLI